MPMSSLLMWRGPKRWQTWWKALRASLSRNKASGKVSCGRSLSLNSTRSEYTLSTMASLHPQLPFCSRSTPSTWYTFTKPRSLLDLNWQILSSVYRGKRWSSETTRRSAISESDLRWKRSIPVWLPVHSHSNRGKPTLSPLLLAPPISLIYRNRISLKVPGYHLSLKVPEYHQVAEWISIIQGVRRMVFKVASQQYHSSTISPSGSSWEAVNSQGEQTCPKRLSVSTMVFPRVSQGSAAPSCWQDLLLPPKGGVMRSSSLVLLWSQAVLLAPGLLRFLWLFMMSVSLLLMVLKYSRLQSYNSFQISYIRCISCCWFFILLLLSLCCPFGRLAMHFFVISGNMTFAVLSLPSSLLRSQLSRFPRYYRLKCVLFLFIGLRMQRWYNAIRRKQQKWNHDQTARYILKKAVRSWSEYYKRQIRPA